MRAQIKKAALVVVCVSPMLLFARQSGSVPPEVVEPIITEETLPEEPGECNLRISTDYRAMTLEPANALPRLQFFFGFLRRWGVEVDAPFAYPDQQVNNLGFGDVSTTLKYEVNRQDRRVPAVVLGVEARFPTGSPIRGTGEEGFEFAPFVALLAQGSRLGLQGNVGVGFPAGSTDQVSRTYYNAAATLRVTSGHLYFIAEANGAHSSAGDSVFSLSPGLHYGISKHLFVAVAIPVRVVGGAGRAGIVVQIQFRLRGEQKPE